MKLNEITTIFFDVDGIFTDGSLYLSNNGMSITKFNVHDGMGCILLKELGVELLILTARHSDEVIKRFKDLGINKVFTKILKKKDFIKEYSKTHNLKRNEIAMMGDDLQDLAATIEQASKNLTANKQKLNGLITDCNKQIQALQGNIDKISAAIILQSYMDRNSI